VANGAEWAGAIAVSRAAVVVVGVAEGGNVVEVGAEAEAVFAVVGAVVADRRACDAKSLSRTRCRWC